MAVRALARLRRSTCALHLRTATYTSQDTRKAHSFTTTASTDESCDKNSESGEAAHSTEKAVETAPSDVGQFQTLIKVRAPYIRFVVGRSGSTRNNIERTTKAHIDVPPAKEVRSDVSVVIKGPSQESVDEAVAKVRNILQRAEQNSTLEYSHLVSLPLASHPDLVERMKRFKESVLAEENESYVSWFPATVEADGPSNVPIVKSTSKIAPKIKARNVLDPNLEGFFTDDDYDESSDDEDEISGKKRGRIKPVLFTKPETMHMTLFMLKLSSDERVNLAAEVLQDVEPKVLETLDGHEPKVHLRGIELLRGTPTEARALSMRVEEIGNDGHVKQACQVIKDAYRKAGLLSPAEQRQDLKLHVMLMSTSSWRRRNRDPFDARKLLSKHHREDWGEHVIKEVHLSQRFFYDRNGYYRCCGSFELLPSQQSLSSCETSTS